MKNWYSRLDICYKTAFISTIVMIVAILGTSCLFFMGYMEIPFGILLGCSVGIISYVLMGLVGAKGQDRKTTGTIIVNIVRFVLLAAAMFLAGWLYYKSNIHIFNVFAVAGGYIIPIICLCVIVGKEGKNNV